MVSEAISKFHGAELQGRALKVNEARERSPRPFVPRSDSFGGPPPQDLNVDDFRGKPAKPKGSRRGLRGRKRGF